MGLVADLDADGVVDRLREALGCDSDAALVRRLDLASGAVANWRARGSVPLSHCVSAAMEGGWSLNWLVLGVGPRRRGESAAAATGEEPGAYRVETAAAEDRASGRLGLILAWWGQWWERASPQERVWAEVQLRRSYPEFAEWVRGRDGAQSQASTGAVSDVDAIRSQRE